jgi:hypothetical protein
MDLVGYVTAFGDGQLIYLVPSKEYGQFFLPHYSPPSVGSAEDRQGLTWASTSS